MSRLIVKNLPTYITDQRLRDHFSQQPSSSKQPYTITDARIARKPDGTSRKFGFVGYKTNEEASRAQEYWNRTFIDGSRISVEVVEDKHEPRRRKAGDENVPPHPLKSSNDRSAKNENTQPKKDSQKDKFVNAVTAKSQSRTWADDVLPAPEPGKPDKPKKKTKDAEADQSMTAQEEEEARAEGISDLEWMRRRMTKSLEADEEFKGFSQSDSEDDGSPNQAEEDKKAERGEAEKAQARETILSTGRLFLRNLAYTCTAAELEEHFAPFGEIEQVHLPLTPQRTPSGLAFITFAQPESALKAYEALDGTSFQGRLLHILPAVDKRPRTDTSTAPKSLKDKKLDERKKHSARGWDWGVLYLNPDAVASAVATKLGVDKSELLNPEEGNAAVKLALAETSVVQETKEYLEKNGVELGAFSRLGKQRSPTTVLVKNLPAFTTQQQIRELFAPHGTLSKVLVPPSGAIALVEFENETEAAVAWRNVNFRRFGGSIIYLERGPVDLWKKDVTPVDGAEEGTTKASVVALPEDEQPEEAAPGSMLYIKNLSFATSNATLSTLFSALPGFLYARVQTKPNPKDPSARLSMGYGFAGFRSREEAERARKAMDGATCDGHKLSVRFAGRGKEEDAAAEDKAADSLKLGNRKTAKMIVKNVPFEATKADIRGLFQGYGQLKSVRLPTKFDRRTRGFAFLEFTTRREAENAMAALKHTHLLGRHLVLEWAEDAQGMEILREKTKRAFGDGKEIPNKRRKLELGEGGEAEEED